VGGTAGRIRPGRDPAVNGDLLVIVPSRGRSRSIARLLGAVHSTSRARTHVHVAVDEDDDELPRYEAVMAAAAGADDVLERGSRKGLTAWTNEIAMRRARQYPYLASFGDDHVPRTPGWDAALIRGIQDLGGAGVAYPWDSTREDVPEAVVMSSDIVQALGWMCEPSLSHWFVDNVWADLGRGAGCIRHLRAVAVDHVHPATGQAKADATSQDNGRSLEADRDAYWTWRRERMASDIEKIAMLRELRARGVSDVTALQPA
jgi:hypothetical protein